MSIKYPEEVPGTGIELYSAALWNRTTVADGKWLQNNTLKPLYDNELVLASAIHSTSASLQGEVDDLKAATDVIDVVATYSSLQSWSHSVTSADVIKVLHCEPVTAGGDTYSGQVYFRYEGQDAQTADPSKWVPFASLDPYYSESQINEMFNNLNPVAFTGSYNDLSDKPTIPTVNDGKLTISRNGTALGSFTANQSSLLGIDISVPTKTSDLVNDSLLINDGTLTIKQNGVSKGTFSANQLGNATIDLDDTTTVSSVEKTALGEMNTLPVASMVSSAFKAGTFLLKATADGGEPYVFNDVTIPNNQWYRFTVNGESSNYCEITLEIVAGSASSAFGTFKLLVDNGSVKNVVRVPYATKTAAVGSVTTPVYVDGNGEIKECTSVAQKASSGSGNLAVIDGNGNYSSSGISAYDQTMLNGLTSRLGSFVSAINSFSHSFNVIFNSSDISKTLDFENTYASIKFLRFGISYISGKISYRLPWSGASADYNGWIIAPDTQTKNGKSIVHTTHTFTVAGNTNTEELYEENELGTTGQSVASIFEKQITTSQTVRGRLSSEIRLYNGISYKELIVHVDIGYERLSSTGAFYAFGTVTCNTDLFEND